MSETMIPTMSLRFVERSQPAPELEEGIARTVRILQQLFHTASGPKWIDVPSVKESQ